MPRAKVVSFINYKGGVAKTTTTYHVGCALAQKHQKRVLLIDIDPQTNLTFLCGTVAQWQRFQREKGTIRDLYQHHLKGQALDTKRYIWREPIGSAVHKRVAGVDLIPCDIDLIGEDLGGGDITGTFPSFEQLKQHAKKYVTDRSFIRRVIHEIEDDYDYVLIDCPPNLYLMTQNALVASERYIVTAIPDHLSTIGLNILRNKAKKIDELLKSARNFVPDAPTLRAAQLGGIIFVRVRLSGSMVTTLHKTIMHEVRSDFGDALCFADHTTELIGYGEASDEGLPVWLADSRNAKNAAARQEYEKITREFVSKF